MALPGRPERAARAVHDRGVRHHGGRGRTGRAALVPTALIVSLLAGTLFVASRGDSTASAKERTALPADPAAASPAAAEIEAALSLFYFDKNATQAEQTTAFTNAVVTARDWITDTEPPTTEADLPVGFQVAEVATMVIDTAGGWIHVDSARRFLDTWTAWLDEDEGLSGAVGREYFGTEFVAYSRFVRAMDGAAGSRALLTDAVLQRIDAVHPAEYRRALVARADSRRLLGDFAGAMADLDLSEQAGSEVTEADEDLYLRAMERLKLEIDLGRVDRASDQLKTMRELAKRLGLGESGELLRTAYELLYLSSAGRHDAVARIASSALEGDLEHMTRSSGEAFILAYSRALLAIGIGRSSNDPDELRIAEETLLRLIAPESKTELSVVKIAAIECAAVALRRGEPDRAREVLDQLERRTARPSTDGIASRLYRTRIATRRLEIALADERASGEERRLATERLQREFEGLFESWSELDDIPGGVGFLQFVERQDALSLLVQQLVSGSERGDAAALDLVLQADARSTIARRLDAPPATADQLVEACARTRSAIVVLLPTRTRTHRFLVTAEGVEHDDPPGAEYLKVRSKRILKWLEELPSPGATGQTKDPELREALDELARALVPGPLLTEPQRFSSIDFVGTGMLGRVPLEVLPTETDEELGLAVPLARIPSAAAALEVKRRHDLGSAGGVAMYALPKSQHRKVGINFTGEDFERLREAADTSITFDSKRRATKEVFFESMLAGDELFIALTHGVTNRDADVAAGLYVMTPAGATAAHPGSKGVPKLPNQIELLGGDEIDAFLRGTAAGAAPRIVFLAACDTAIGHSRVGDEAASHLGGVFLSAGSEVVIVADRPVEQNTAILFMTEFCEAYLGEEKMTSGEAIRHARQELAISDGFASPHYWAALQLFGSSSAQKR